MNRKKQCFFTYSVADMEAAIAAMKDLHASNELPKVRAVAKKFGVPHVTLRRKLMEGKGAVRKMGPQTVLTKEEEALLVKWVLANSKKGIPLNKSALCQTVKRILDDADQRTVPFKDNYPGNTWFTAFLRRHPDISKRHAEGINTARASVTEENIREWHAGLYNFLEEEGVSDILKCPRRIINADESGFATCPKTGVVLGPRGGRNFYIVNSGSEKENITVLVTITAAGEMLPPMIILPYERIPKNIVDNLNPEWSVGRSKSGWMTGETFFSYVANCLIPHLKETKVKFPVLFLIDGHKSHLTMQVATLCKENDIILYALYPNATHVLQPADVSVFRPLKMSWQNVVAEWKRKTGNRSVTKQLFGPLLESAVATVSPEIIQNGFRKCGLFPFNPDAIDFTKVMTHESRCEQILKPAEFHVQHLLFVESMMPSTTVKQFKQKLDLEETEKDGTEGKETEGTDIDAEPGKDATGKGIDEILMKQTELEKEEDGKGIFRISSVQSEGKTIEKVGISPSFADHVLWPTDSPQKRGKKRERLPHAATSKRWLQYHDEKEKEKQKQESLKMEKKRLREERKSAKKDVKKGLLDSRVSSSSDDAEELFGLPSSDDCSWGEPSDHEVVHSLTLEEGVIIEPGNWILVRYTSSKKSIFYVGVVEKIINGHFEINCLRRRGTSYVFAWPTVPGKDVVPKERIEARLAMISKPGTSRTSQLYGFKENLCYYASSLR